MTKPPASPPARSRAKRGAAGAASAAAASASSPAESRARAAKPAPPAHAPNSAAAMLESGMKALERARKSAENGPAAKVVASLIDPFGFRKLEDVFDQRVASALERLGQPSPDVLIALLEEIQALRARVEQLEKARR
ncbi:hypothetical protein BH11PSE8_BH11PSE8_04380 [soil metagenome]